MAEFPGRPFPWRLLIWLAIATTVAVAYHGRFLIDDALISFRYAEHLANGHGLVWNIGEKPIEGFSNFLWTAILAVGIKVGIPAGELSFVLGTLCGIGTLVCTGKMAAQLGTQRTAFMAVVLLGVNYSFRSFITSGMETQLQTCLLAGVVLISARRLQDGAISRSDAARLSLLCSAALITRLDSAVLVLPVLLIYLLHMVRSKEASRPSIAWLGLPLLLVVGGWLAWKQFYFGEIIPNSVRLKISTSLPFGTHHLSAFLMEYWLLPFVLALPVLLYLGRRTAPVRMLGFHATLVVLWWSYVVKVGGDFMEFRFFVPVMPQLMCLLAWAFDWTAVQLATWDKNVTGRWISFGIRPVCIAILCAGSIHHQRTFETSEGIDSIPMMSLLGSNVYGWGRLGLDLRSLFGPDPTFTLAVTPAGAIPYYSGYRTIDMLGLNDGWVARNGTPINERPGHQRLATYRYLIAQEVNLVIMQPQFGRTPLPSGTVVPLGEWTGFADRMSDPENVPSSASLLEIPLPPGGYLYAIYLTPHSLVDERIARGWRTFALRSP